MKQQHHQNMKQHHHQCRRQHRQHMTSTKFKQHHKNNAKRAKTTNKVEKKIVHALFIIVPLNLTLNNTFASLVNDYYLGTLIYHMILRFGCRFYERTYLVFQKRSLKKNRFITNFHSCENLRLILNLILTCNDANQFSL